MSTAEFYKDRAESNMRVCRNPLDRHFWAADRAYWTNRAEGKPALKILDAMSVAHWYATKYDRP